MQVNRTIAAAAPIWPLARPGTTVIRRVPLPKLKQT
jgi:hypothetical protein